MRLAAARTGGEAATEWREYCKAGWGMGLARPLPALKFYDDWKTFGEIVLPSPDAPGSGKTYRDLRIIQNVVNEWEAAEGEGGDGAGGKVTTGAKGQPRRQPRLKGSKGR